MAEGAEEGRSSAGWKFHTLPTHDDSASLSTLLKAFDTDGFVCLSSVFDSSIVDRLRTAACENFSECFQRLYAKGHTGFPTYCKGEGEYALQPGVKGGFREIVMRAPGRFEIPYGCDRGPFNTDEIIRNDRLLKLVRALLSNDDEVEADGGVGNKEVEGDDGMFYLCNASIVNSTPGSGNQSWHADGGHLNLQAHERCHVFNIFIPLVDVDRMNGPTELRPGSHYLTRNLAPLMLAAKARGTLRTPVMPLLRAGDALIFDYRVLHRGRANLSDADRPIFVMTFAKCGFKDRLNFPSRSIEDDPSVEEAQPIGEESSWTSD